MSPVEHYRRAFLVGLLSLFAGGVEVAWAFFGRAPDGQLRLACWAGRLGDAGLKGGLPRPIRVGQSYRWRVVDIETFLPGQNRPNPSPWTTAHHPNP
jgi:hypothetical protein